jgi:tetratricopeptide (TPR) repeat protein
MHAIYTGDWQRAGVYFEEGRVVAGTVEMSGVRGGVAGYALLGLGRLHFLQGDNEQASQYLDEALALAQRNLPPRLLRPVQGCLAERDLLAGHAGDALERLEPILASQEGRDGIDSTPLLPFLAWAHLELGDLSRAEDALREALARARREHHQLALLDTLCVQALLAIRSEQWDEAVSALEEALNLARSMPYPYAEAKALSTYGDLLVARGQPEQARDQYEAALMILRSLGERTYSERIERALAETARH